MQTMDIAKLAQETKKISEISRDYVVSTDRMRATPKVGKIVLSVDDLGEFDITELCHKQIAAKTEIPYKYYERVQAASPQLLADNVNQWLQARDKRMIRTLNYAPDKLNQCRAFLSSRYKPLDNLDVLLTTLKCFQEYREYTGNQVQIRQAWDTGESFYIKALTPTYADIVEGDRVFAGLLISNSEVGARTLRIQPATYRLSCGNDMILQKRYSYFKTHAGKDIHIENVYSDVTRKSQDETIWLEVQDIIKATLRGEFLKSYVEDMRVLKGMKFEKPKEEAIEKLKKYRFSEKEAENILDDFITERDFTGFGFVQSITSIAKREAEIDRQIEIEETGHKAVLDLLGAKEEDITIGGVEPEEEKK